MLCCVTSNFIKMAYFGDFLKCVALYYVFNRLAKVEVAGSSPVYRSPLHGLVKPFFLFVNFFTRFTLRIYFTA